MIKNILHNNGNSEKNTQLHLCKMCDDLYVEIEMMQALDNYHMNTMKTIDICKYCYWNKDKFPDDEYYCKECDKKLKNTTNYCTL